MPRNPKRNKTTQSPKSSANLSSSSPDPFPEHHQPTPAQCRAVRDDLLALHGLPRDLAKYRNPDPSDEAPPEKTVLDGVVSTLLSQNTTDSNSRRAFLSLKSAFPAWEDVLNAEPKRVEDAIRCGGLAVTKASRIRSILKDVMERRGEICLEYLRALSVGEVKAELSRFKGIGPKTVACVLMFHLHQDDFPVDTHVFRITKAIGWVPMKADREKAYLHLNNRIPNDLKFDLNCLLITHGKLCPRCAKRASNQQSTDSPCPLTKLLS
ncbi:putative DNA glycosylase At3g47830 isoform X1 [Dioscorea cayenensis subsp. rotundata]|uniref:DNA glycosylase At3g47830 isoform X1 n=1 Tax=Dioscorea cayennensis subsp. rotundata TaxID=55577 RepID=A0AB40BUM5_DIOCR|nr:putative DNA glycosylase At3g47830 isoform X1 [Dioscorea cayenensis subsp. rotundata]XP_039130633.1 putative DNA glycosylase At3g47830 isoform X1 [Dioscorea cayenensis subsp. rotundata]XP_039130634.1 putative DNA glycosylase At3g47830 isoform X1 [Dioscorea cayenensis subsp. rotundata]